MDDTELVYVPKRIKFFTDKYITARFGVPKEYYNLYVAVTNNKIEKSANLVKKFGMRLDTANDKTPDLVRIKWQKEYLDALNELIDLCEGK